MLTRLAGAPPPAPGGAPPADFDETPVGAGAGGAAQGYGLPEEGGYPAEEDEDGRQMRRALSSNGNGDAAGRGKGPLSAKASHGPETGAVCTAVCGCVLSCLPTRLPPRRSTMSGRRWVAGRTRRGRTGRRRPPQLRRPVAARDDLPDPEPLGQADLADAQQLIDMSSEYVAQCAYSKQHR